MAYTLQLIHANDLEGGVAALDNAPNFAAILDHISSNYENTVLLSAGDNYIPGPFFSTAADFSISGTLNAAYARLYTEILGVDLDGIELDLGRGGGRVDITIMNVMGFDASAVGNHEFDPGTSAFASIIGGDGAGGVIEWPGTFFPYLTSNIEFSGDGALADLFTADILASSAYNESLADLAAGNIGPSIAPATIVDVNGESIGVVGATTQIIESISSTGGADEITGGSNNMAALAAVIQPQIDALLAQGVNKIILTSHLQQIALEKELAGLLSGVDIILAGGSNTLQADANDVLRAGDTADETYPFLTQNADGNDVAIVSTDGEYSYVGRLVVDFDDDGNLIASSIDAAVSGAYATDEAGTLAVLENATILGAQDIVASEAQEVTPVADTDATAAFDIYVDGNVLVVEGMFSGLASPLLDVSADGTDPEGNPIDGVHLHQAAAGANGPVIRALTTTEAGDGSGIFAGRFILTDDELAALNAGEIYINIHTADNPGGELRGQLPGAEDLGDVTPSLSAGLALSTRADIVGDLTAAVQTIVEEADTVVFGAHDVFLDGRRESVRTEETNLGNLSADANLAAARAVDDSVMVSFKNGGGIRAEIGSAGDLGNDAGDGLISQLDLQNALRFNNDLTLVTLSAEGFLLLLEHAVAETDTEAGNTPGRFPQIGGFRFSFDETAQAQQFATTDDGDYIVDPSTGLPVVQTAGARVQTIALTDPETGADTIIYQDGAFTAEAPSEIRMVTLDFLVENNGDGYPFQQLATDIQYVTQDGGTTVDASADNILEEQEALGSFMAENFPDEDNAFAAAEQDVFNDARIVQLARNGGIDRITLDQVADPLEISLLSTLDNVDPEADDPEGSAEVVATENGKAYVTNGLSDAIDIFDVSTGALLQSIGLTEVPMPEGAAYDGVQSVAALGGIIAVAIAAEGAEGAEAPGVVALFGADGTLLNSVEVGNLPDMLTFTPDGSKILVANEGEPLENSNPQGSVSIIDMSMGAEAATVMTLDFTAFDGQEASLLEAGVLLEPGVPVSQDLEPEYITVLPGGETAWVSLQEANAYAVLDLTTMTVTDIRSFGVVDRSEPGFELDASNEDNAINLQNYDNLVGMRQPDAITAVEIGGEIYILTANEGDARDATEARVADLTLDPVAFPNAEVLQLDENLGRLNVRTDLGDTDGDGDYDMLYHYGSRSFTIYDVDGNIVYDSGSEFSQLIAEIRPDLFNTSNSETPDGRSDDKGVEPEAITVGEVNGTTYAFIGLERDSGVFVYDLTNPAAPVYNAYIDGLANGNIAPETISFIAAEDSDDGLAKIAVAYEADGRTAVFNLGETINQTITGDAGNDAIAAEAGDDLIAVGEGDDLVSGGAGDDTIGAGPGDDIAAGGAGDDQIFGGAGDDVVFGGDGDDFVNGGRGNDLLSGGAGNDSLAGGAGDDNVSGGAGDDDLSGSFGDDNLGGGAGMDVIGGGSGRDTIGGGAGDDQIGAGLGADLVSGGTGNDFVAGGGGNDTVFGGAGADTINGGTGNDLLYGGADADLFVFVANSGNDTVGDFDVTEDMLRISKDLAGGIAESEALLNAVADFSDTGAVLRFEDGSVLSLMGEGLQDNLADMIVIL